jgi:hypothetical protein
MLDREKLDLVFEFSLFEALAHRRVRRFGLGYEFTKETFRYRSDKQPVPLDELETALLAWAAHGINGLALGEGQITTGVHSTWNGRVHPCACNDQRALLVIVNDDGVFAYQPPDATQVVEISTREDRDKIVQAYRGGIQQLGDTRPDFTDAAWISGNIWMANRPGSTLFFPVVDTSAKHINSALAAFEREGLRIVDKRTGQWAGIGKWIDNGMLDGAEVTMQFVDYNTLNAQSAAAHFMAQNIGLACEAIGVGYVVTGCVAPVVLGGTPFTEGLGCRFISDKDGQPNPVGLDGHLEGHCPPYFESMDEAVDDFLAIRYGDNGILLPEYQGPTPLKNWALVASKAKKLSQEAIQATKDFCNYVYDTYGRFPALIDTVQLPIVITVHHLDLDFYREFFPSEAISETMWRHMSTWHDE